MARKLTGRRVPYQKPSDKFWRDCFMKVLECFEQEELTWSKDNWQKYGVSNADRARIEQEFRRWQNLPRTTVKNGIVYNGKGEAIGARG